MARVFNTAGPCRPEEHYMIPVEQRAPLVKKLVEAKNFFGLHSPRQSGKTTILRNISRSLTSDNTFAAITVSLETCRKPTIDEAIPSILARIRLCAKNQLPEKLQPVFNDDPSEPCDIALISFLSQWSDGIDRPLVVFFDEIDSLRGEVLVSVLQQLRDGYTSRPAPFPQSIALAGMWDVLDYDVVDGTGGLGSSSPFNIKIRSLSLDDFTCEEVKELLCQHTKETGQIIELEAQEEIYRQTKGQPWLVNSIAGQLMTDCDALAEQRDVSITKEMVLKAREILIKRRDTHLDSLVKRLKEERVKRIVEPILTGEVRTDPTYDEDVRYVCDIGLVSQENGALTIANPIYKEIIPRVLNAQVHNYLNIEPKWFVAADGSLDFNKLIDGFITFWRENGEVLLAGMPYHEAAPHLVFMAYLQRVVNSGGTISREFALGSKRADIVVSFNGQKDVIELKLAHAYKALERGLEQVSEYAIRLGRDRGYLVLFDTNAATSWENRGRVDDQEVGEVMVKVVRL